MSLITVQPIIPRKGIQLPDMQPVIEEVLMQAAKDALKEYKATVRTWSRKPDFFIDPLISSGEVIVGTDNEIYGYVDKGTRPHVITPVRAPALRFNTVYKAKTRVRQLQSTGGGSSPPVAFAQKVKHPGIKARDFTKLIQKRAQRRFRRDAQKAINKALKKGGF